MLKLCRLLTTVAETGAKYLKGDRAGSSQRKARAPGDQSFRHRCPTEIPDAAAEVQNKHHTKRTDRHAKMRRSVAGRCHACICCHGFSAADPQSQHHVPALGDQHGMPAYHAVPYRAALSCTLASAPWKAHEWLAEVAMADAFYTGAWSSLSCLFAIAAATAAELPAHHLACACESSLAFNRHEQIMGPGPAVVRGAALSIRHLPDDLGQALGPCRRDGLASRLALALHGRFRRCSHSRQIRAVTRLRS
jgi:hypothetical protein